MGIKGLHKALSFCTVKDNVRHYQNMRVAVDASAWLHRSVYSVAEELAETPPNTKFNEHCVQVSCRYMIKRCLELIHGFGIKAVFLVTDGQRSPMKADESSERNRKHIQLLEEARQFKRNGNNYKAEERYKACIRIREEFANEVMSRVRTEFKKQEYVQTKVSVHVIPAPYEADAQLCKLIIDNAADVVITEDSDVLAYSAAAHIAFPILYKLDRNTGNCDRISMDWLLSPPLHELTTSSRNNNNNTSRQSSTSSIEFMMRRLASRQHKRKGFGVRLFIQACVLAGCDYSVNQLDGVGLVKSFQLVRDHAIRNDTVRFRKILESLPRKIKHTFDMNKYEETLSKSEAIFYYHHVLHLDGSIKPMLPPRVSLSESDTNDNDQQQPPQHNYTDHFPFMERFGNDWSFLGVEGMKDDENFSRHQKTIEPSRHVLTTTTTVSQQQQQPRPIVKRKALSIQQPSNNNNNKPPKIMENPYIKSNNRNNNKMSTTNAISHGGVSSRSSSLGEIKTTVETTGGGQQSFMMKYLTNAKDYRLLKNNQKVSSAAANEQQQQTTSTSTKRSHFFDDKSRQQQPQQQRSGVASIRNRHLIRNRSLKRKHHQSSSFDYYGSFDDSSDDDDDDDRDVVLPRRNLLPKSSDQEDHCSGGSQHFGDDVLFGFDTYSPPKHMYEAWRNNGSDRHRRTSGGDEEEEEEGTSGGDTKSIGDDDTDVVDNTQSRSKTCEATNPRSPLDSQSSEEPKKPLPFGSHVDKEESRRSMDNQQHDDEEKESQVKVESIVDRQDKAKLAEVHGSGKAEESNQAFSTSEKQSSDVPNLEPVTDESDDSLLPNAKSLVNPSSHKEKDCPNAESMKDDTVDRRDDVPINREYVILDSDDDDDDELPVERTAMGKKASADATAEHRRVTLSPHQKYQTSRLEHDVKKTDFGNNKASSLADDESIMDVDSPDTKDGPVLKRGASDTLSLKQNLVRKEHNRRRTKTKGSTILDAFARQKQFAGQFASLPAPRNMPSSDSTPRAAKAAKRSKGSKGSNAGTPKTAQKPNELQVAAFQSYFSSQTNTQTNSRNHRSNHRRYGSVIAAVGAGKTDEDWMWEGDE